MAEVKDLTNKQVMAADRAVSRVRDAQGQGGTTVPGCSLPIDIMFLNAWTQSEIKGTIAGIEEALKVMREKHRGKNKQGEEKPWDQDKLKKFQEDYDKFMDKKAEGLVLKTFSLKKLQEVDSDPFFKESNKKNPIPQEYISSLMEAGLLEDDVN